MPRKLPWAISTTQDTGRATASRSPKPKEADTASPELKHKDPEIVKKSTVKVPQKDRKHERRRSHSSSPAPALLKIEFMRQGYNADDIYVMVEDEFYSVAQSFTAHLHHAEYKRLMQKARDAPPRPPPTLTHSMSSDVKRRVTRTLLDQTQKKAMRSMLGKSVEADVEDEEMDDTGIDDPWSGTSLASLMASGSQQKTSLVGLGGVPSTTRAALGYKKSTGDSERSLKRKEPDSGHVKHETTSSPATSTKESRDSVMRRVIDDFIADDNNTPDTSPRPEKSRAEPKRKKEPGDSRSRSKRSFIDDLEESDKSSTARPQRSSARVKSPSSDHDKRKASEQTTRHKKLRLDEVPVFLAS